MNCKRDCVYIRPLTVILHTDDERAEIEFGFDDN